MRITGLDSKNLVTEGKICMVKKVYVNYSHSLLILHDDLKELGSRQDGINSRTRLLRYVISGYDSWFTDLIRNR